MPEEKNKKGMTELDVTVRARIAVGAEFSRTNLDDKLVVGLLLDAETDAVLNDDSKSTRFFVVDYQETTARQAQETIAGEAGDEKTKYFICAASDGDEIYGKPMILTESELEEERRKASDATGDEWHIAVLMEIGTVNF